MIITILECDSCHKREDVAKKCRGWYKVDDWDCCSLECALTLAKEKGQINIIERYWLDSDGGA